jgi:primosomal protein N' (replication factor Y)
MIDIAHTNVDKTFEYAVPDDLDLCAGQRVLVPFGRGDKPVEAFVAAVYGAPQSDKILKAVLRALEPYPVLTGEQLALAEWMRDKYSCLLVQAIRLMIPAQLRGERVSEKTVFTARLTDDRALVEHVKASLMTKDGALKAPRQMDIITLLEGGAELPLTELEGFARASRSAVDALVKKGCVIIERREVLRRAYDEISAQAGAQLTLTDEQDEAVARMSHGGRFLLHGVTGSGKTEVYMRLIRRCLDRGEGAIVLVPEIALTPQTVQRFRSRFDSCVAVLHSRLSPGERYDEWRSIREGRARVVVGARSAVFAPVERLGLIVIDEEHEGSYLSEMNPRYNALEVAEKRCDLTGASLVLGSATPSVKTYHRAALGELELVELTRRINGEPLPAVELVDMRNELLQGNRSIFSGRLYNALKECLDAGRQAILFINRRGYSTFVSCRACGYVLKCAHCDVSLTYHKFGGKASCHYCGRENPVPAVCPQCGKPYLKFFGAGTQQVEEHVRKLFPEASLIRMDMDTTRTKDAHYRLLSKFARREAQILIGTQMIAKGLDFPFVTLVGVVAADATLFIPDFRSAERTFQLITQVAGRAGRDEAEGRVIVQTYSPSHPSVALAARYDYKGFYDYEIRQRENAEFPPFSLFLRALVTCAEEDETARLAKDYREHVEALLKARCPDAIITLFDSPAPIKRIKDKFRYQVLIKLRRTVDTDGVVSEIYAYTRELRKDALITIETDPENMA